MEKVILGLSDGVDSAAAGLMLKRAGYEVRGVYLDIAGEEGRRGAEKSAREIGIEFEIVDIKPKLEACVCTPFIDEYLRGRTPSPCTVCNRDVKLPTLIDIADRLGAEKIATGHYVRSDGTHLFMGENECDQSYMFARITPAQTRRLLLPLGEMKKQDVRAFALQNGVSACNKPDSRENCFIRGTDYASYIESRRPGEIPGPGPVLFRGEMVDTHEGFHRYTVGQRWKSDMGPRRAYVSKIDCESNTITLSLWEELFTCKTALSQLSFISGSAPGDEFDASIRVRHTRWETPACRVKLTRGGAEVTTETPLRAPAPGQTAALYMGNMLIGGGTVERAE